MPSDPTPSEPSAPSKTQILEQFDWTTCDSVCAGIVNAVAEVSGESPMELPPLYETVNTDALDVLVSNGPASAGEGEVAVTFTYEGYDVVVSSAGDGHVASRDSELAG